MKKLWLFIGWIGILGLSIVGLYSAIFMEDIVKVTLDKNRKVVEHTLADDEISTLKLPLFKEAITTVEIPSGEGNEIVPISQEEDKEVASNISEGVEGETTTEDVVEAPKDTPKKNIFARGFDKVKGLFGGDEKVKEEVKTTLPEDGEELLKETKEDVVDDTQEEVPLWIEEKNSSELNLLVPRLILGGISLFYLILFFVKISILFKREKEYSIKTETGKLVITSNLINKLVMDTMKENKHIATVKTRNEVKRNKVYIYGEVEVFDDNEISDNLQALQETIKGLLKSQLSIDAETINIKANRVLKGKKKTTFKDLFGSKKEKEVESEIIEVVGEEEVKVDEDKA